MGSTVVLVGSMPSLASVIVSTALITTPSTSTSLEFWSQRVSFSRPSLRRLRRWHSLSSSVCKYSVAATDFLPDSRNARTVDSDASNSSTLRATSNADYTEIALKPAPKPVFKSGVDSLLSGKPVERQTSRVGPQMVENVGGGGAAGGGARVEDRNKVIQSLGEVLEKAEKLETSKPANLISGVKENRDKNKVAPSTTASNSRDAYSTAAASARESKNVKSVKSVWRKGDAVTSKVVKVDHQKTNSTVQRESIKEEDAGLESQNHVALRPLQPPLRPQPKLQARPSAAPPPSLKKPVILKDVGAAPKPPVLDQDELGSEKSKERKTILVDKFARKEPIADPLIPEAVLPPTKPVKGAASGKYKDRKSSGGQRRRIVHDDSEIVAEEASKLNVPIKGATAIRKGRKWSKASRKAARLLAAKHSAPVKAEILEVGEKGMLIEELAYNLAIGEGEILGYLYSRGIKPDGVQTLDKDMVKMICKEHEVEVIDANPVRVEEMARKKEILDEDDLDKLVQRPPVLTIMGHVDHGKTTLLDYIRKSKVAASEAGGITQGIGAYKVFVPLDGNLQPCVFLDTPGHEAFGAMRARGARVTDIAIIVVAADDGIRPQTTEAVAHAKAAGVPIIVAINKIDKEGANAQQVMQDLSSIGLMPEDWGGDIPMVQISALKGDNVDELMETVMLVAELQDLKANPDRSAKGTVIEAALDKSKGPVATFIIQNGTLRRGDIVVCGEASGKVRALFDDGGHRINEAGPSMPVQVIGLNSVPIAGDEFEVVPSLDIAREKAAACAESLHDELISTKAGDGKITLSSLASAVSAGKLSGFDLHQLNVLLKVDVQGSIEAVRQALQVLPQDNVTLKFLLQAAGDVSTSDIDLAVAGEAIVLGFNVKVPGSVKSYAQSKGVEIREYKVIYELIDDVRDAMEGLLEPAEEEETIGSAEVRAVFSSGSGRAAGCMVTEGRMVKGCGIKVLRNGKIVHVGVLDSLRRVKEIVKEVNAGLECGIAVADYDDWREGDSIEAFNRIPKKRTLEEASALISTALGGANL